MSEAPERNTLAGILQSRLFHDLLIVCAVFAPIRFLCFPSVFLPKPFRLPEEAYLAPFVALETLQHPNSLWWFVLAAGFTVAHFVKHPKNPFGGTLRWGTTEAPGIRLLVLGLALPVAWKLTTHDINLYFDQVHLLDRILVAVLYVAMWRTPLAIPWFVGLTAAFMSQFHYPEVFHFTWADKAILYYGLILIWVSFVLSKLRRLDAAVVPALMLAMFGSFYLYPGITKVSLTHHVWDWLTFNPVYDLFVGAWLHGWWGPWDYEAIQPVYRLLRATNLMSTGFTMFFEFGIVVILLHRRLTILFLCLAVVFHTAVYAASGILFWEWWAPELTMLYLMFRDWKRPEVAKIYTSPVRFMSPMLIICALPVFWPYALGWLDSPYTPVFEIEVQEEGSDEWIVLNRGDMDPYNLPMTQNRFGYLLEGPHVKTGAYGAVSDADVQIGLMQAQSPDDVLALLEEYGWDQRDPEAERMFTVFLTRYFVHENARENHTSLVPWFMESLHHQYAMSGSFRYPGAPPVRRVRMTGREYWHDGEQIHVLRDEIILDITIPEDAPPLAGAHAGH